MPPDPSVRSTPFNASENGSVTEPGPPRAGEQHIPPVTGPAALATPTARSHQRLPSGQPARALSAVAIYVVTVAAAAGPFLLIFGSPLGWLLLFALACLLTVPLAVSAPTARPEETPRSNQPVLRRGG